MLCRSNDFLRAILNIFRHDRASKQQTIAQSNVRNAPAPETKSSSELVHECGSVKSWAVRVLWVVLRGQSSSPEEASQLFIEHMHFHASAFAFDIDIAHALLSIMLSRDITDVKNEFNTVQSITPGQPIHHQECLASLLGCLRECDFELRLTVLENVFTLLCDTTTYPPQPSTNIPILTSIQNWHSLFMVLFVGLILKQTIAR